MFSQLKTYLLLTNCVRWGTELLLW